MNDIGKKIQALLFVAGESVLKGDLQKLLGISESELETQLLELREQLADQGVCLLLTSQTAGLTTSPSVADFLQQFNAEGDEALSRAAMETLALLAYRGPVGRYDIEAIRGVDTRRILRQLTLRGLVQKIAGEGKVSLYDVSQEFFQHVGVDRREHLPAFEELKNNEALRATLARLHTRV